MTGRGRIEQLSLKERVFSAWHAFLNLSCVLETRESIRRPPVTAYNPATNHTYGVPYGTVILQVRQTVPRSTRDGPSLYYATRLLSPLSPTCYAVRCYSADTETKSSIPVGCPFHHLVTRTATSMSVITLTICNKSHNPPLGDK